MTLKVRFWGVRGSCPVSGPDFAKYGGHTSSVSVETDDKVICFDAGTGLIDFAKYFMEQNYKELHLFMTHLHSDHIIGLPFFAPLWADPTVTIHMYCGTLRDQGGIEKFLDNLYTEPFFPVTLKDSAATMNFHDFMVKEPIRLGDDTHMETVELTHPNDSVGYVLHHKSQKVAMITDTEHTPGIDDYNILSAVQNADLMIYDACYVEEEMVAKKGWGHSTWQEAVKISQKANVKNLALFHHEPQRTDRQLDQIERQAKAEFKTAFAAKQGQLVVI